MQKRQLGNSALQVTEISFGCMSLQGDNQANRDIIQQAVSSGINFFDTADLYDKGVNEVMLGKALKDVRKQVIISTKVGNKWRADGSGWDWYPRKSYILQAAEESLRRLQTDYIDLYQLHGSTIGDPFDEIIEAFELLQQQGKIRYCGISCIRPNVIRKYVNQSRIVSVMMQYSLLDRRPEEEMLDLLLNNKIGVLGRGALAKGLLAGKSATSFLNYTALEIKEAAESINKISGSSRSPGQTAIQFVLHHPALTSAVVGIRTAAQLQDAVATSATKRLTADEVNTLQHTITANAYTEHR